MSRRSGGCATWRNAERNARSVRGCERSSAMERLDFSKMTVFSTKPSRTRRSATPRSQRGSTYLRESSSDVSASVFFLSVRMSCAVERNDLALRGRNAVTVTRPEASRRPWLGERTRGVSNGMSKTTSKREARSDTPTARTSARKRARKLASRALKKPRPFRRNDATRRVVAKRKKHTEAASATRGAEESVPPAKSETSATKGCSPKARLSRANQNRPASHRAVGSPARVTSESAAAAAGLRHKALNAHAAADKAAAIMNKIRKPGRNAVRRTPASADGARKKSVR